MMLYSVPSVLLAAILLLSMVLNLSLKPRFSARLMTVCMTVALLGGLVFYGVGFAQTSGDIFLSIIRTPLSVIRMFVGINELSAIAGSTLVSTPAGLIVFWLIHLLAFYSMASAAMITLGAEALRTLRLFLSRRGDLTLIYGINDNSVALGAACAAIRGMSVVFVAESPSPSVAADLNNRGMSVLAGQNAVDSGADVLRRLRVTGRKVSVYAMDDAEDKNLFYALRLKDALEKAGADPKSTRLTLPGEEEIIAPMLQVSETQYGFGFVNVYKAADLAARAMIRLCPPWNCVRFDADGRAAEDFSCAVVGFGSFGQAVFRQLVMNGQFAGSEFRAAIFSPNYKNESGFLYADSPELFSQYDITGFQEDGRSQAFYEFVRRNLNTLKIIALCTGRDELDREISDNLMLYLKRHQAENICVVRCGRTGVRYQETVGSPIVSAELYTPDMLSAETADRAAVLLNNVYDNSDKSPWEKWLACDIFSKMSSRASADYMPAFIRASGSSRETILSGDWAPGEAMLRALGESEHKRWSAFHYVMGYRAMTREEFEENAAAYSRAKAKGMPADSRIGRDRTRRIHACLIPWEELDELSAREHAATGREVDYKQLDINNVLALPQLLKAMGEDGSAP